jgi:hypothetical protein
MRAFSAKVFVRSETVSATFAGTDWEGPEVVAGAKGFAAGLLDVEKGFEGAELGAEKGFAFWLLCEGFTPNSDSPMLVCLGLGSSAGGDACSEEFLSWSTFEMRVVLIPRTEPSFLRQAFCLHPKT